VAGRFQIFFSRQRFIQVIKSILLVGLGGGIGSMARYLVQKWLGDQQAFPIATFLVNIAGCFLIGVIYGLGERANVLSPQQRLFMTTGFCGGFTTFSAFALENTNLAQSGNFAMLMLYAAGSVVAGIVSVYLGMMLLKF
jgi:fluoride exporter